MFKVCRIHSAQWDSVDQQNPLSERNKQEFQVISKLEERVNDTNLQISFYLDKTPIENKQTNKQVFNYLSVFYHQWTYSKDQNNKLVSYKEILNLKTSVTFLKFSHMQMENDICGLAR